LDVQTPETHVWDAPGQPPAASSLPASSSVHEHAPERMVAGHSVGESAQYSEGKPPPHA